MTIFNIKNKFLIKNYLSFYIFVPIRKFYVMAKKILFSLMVLLSFGFKADAQFGASSGIGIIAGPTFFQSDYGERFDAATNFANNGFGIGIFHITNFSYNYREGTANRKTFFNDHFKLRTELSFQKSEFIHKGQWVEGKPSLIKEQLRAMRGNTAVTNVGMQFDFFPWSIYNSDLGASRYNFAPFVSLGGQYSFFRSKSYSMLGQVDNPAVTPPKYLGASRSESDATFSLVSSVGARYKIGDFEDIILDLRWQYYFSNWVDGLNPDAKLYPENRANDMMFWVSVGYIYRIE